MKVEWERANGQMVVFTDESTVEEIRQVLPDYLLHSLAHREIGRKSFSLWVLQTSGYKRENEQKVFIPLFLNALVRWMSDHENGKNITSIRFNQTEENI